VNLQLDGKVALVSGASRGIGRAIALALAKEGAVVAGVARGEQDLASLHTELLQHNQGSITVVADVTTAAGAAQCIERTVTACGRLDIVICNVGKSFARHASDMTDDDFATSLNMNLWSSMRVAQLAVPHLRSAGGGAITMISSIWGREAGGAPGYNVAKAGVIALAKAMARDYAADHIRVNSVAPGSILFDGGGWARRAAADPQGIADFVAREIPSGRFGTPQEVADVVTFLSSARAQWISGACIVVDGGQARSL
jgi:3-oxoacyl-[acyl-carrier protein] reductase